MVVGEGLFVASLLTLRVVACGNAFSLPLESNLSRSFSSFPASKEYEAWYQEEVLSYLKVMVVGEGLFVASLLTLRVVACGNAFSLRSNRTLVEASHPSLHRKSMRHGANRKFIAIRK